MSKPTFNPDWVVAPGETLREWRESNHLPETAAATACGLRLTRFRQIERGTAPISEDTAFRLAHGTGIPAFLWLNLERNYRAGLAAGKTALTSEDR